MRWEEFEDEDDEDEVELEEDEEEAEGEAKSLADVGDAEGVAGGDGVNRISTSSPAVFRPARVEDRVERCGVEGSSESDSERGGLVA
jgi:hypothetical protein